VEFWHDNELEGIWKEAAVAQFQALPHLTGEDEENHVKGQLE
jgi:hypothetical protein